MNTGDIIRLGKRTYCVLWFTDEYVSLQSMDEDRLLTTIPRTKLGGLKRGT